MTTYPHGTTIEVLHKHGRRSYRVCTQGGGMCRITEDDYQAQTYAKIFEEVAWHVVAK